MDHGGAAGTGYESLGEDDYFSYCVDARTGTLADRIAIEAVEKWDYE